MTVPRDKAQTNLDKVAKGYRVSDDDGGAGGEAADAPIQVDETTPDIEELKRKYLSDAAGDAPRPRRRVEHVVDDSEDESDLVRIEPEGGSDKHDPSTDERTAVFSKDGRVIGMQG
ncbi:MAG: hypothetical protein QOE63_1652 [Acidimicrobiaceae bacterium]|jgi:hypothetical protein